MRGRTDRLLPDDRSAPVGLLEPPAQFGADSAAVPSGDHGALIVAVLRKLLLTDRA
jgi:hypothetical protein